MLFFFFFFKQKTAYEMRISDWSSDVCSSDLRLGQHGLEIVHPSYRVVGDDEAGALGDSLDPVYPAIEGIGPATLRKLIGQALDRLPDADALELLPRDWLDGALPGLREALLTMHRRSEEHTSALPSLMRPSYSVFCLTKT